MLLLLLRVSCAAAAASLANKGMSSFRLVGILEHAHKGKVTHEGLNTRVNKT